MKRLVVVGIAAAVAGVMVAGPAYAVPEQDTPEFGEYLQGLERNGFHLQPDTAWRLGHQTCDGGLPGFIGWELTAQGVVGPGAQLKAADVARKYLCPIQ